MSTDTTAVESKINEMAAREEIDAGAWLEALEEARRAGDPRATGEWAVQAQEILAKAADVEGGFALLKWRAEKTSPAAMTAEQWRQAADRAAGSDPELHTLILEAGFGQRLAARECVRRFTLLRALRKIDSLCWHRTWGLGVVRGFDTTNKRMVVDFRGHPRHLMPLGLAAETMTLVPESHLMAKFHADPELQQLRVKQEPGEVLKDALASFGPLTPAVLQERLTHSGLIPEAEWGAFWSAAKKALKGDASVDIPKKRTDPVRLLDAKSGFEDKWFEQLGADRDLKSILQKVQELLAKEGMPGNLTPEQRQTVGNRVAFVVRGAPSKQPGLRFRGIMFAAKLDMIAADCPWKELTAALLAGKESKEPADAGKKTYPALRELLHDLPARDLAPALDFLHATDADATRAALKEELPRLQYGPLQAAMELLLRIGDEEDCRRIFADAMARRRACQEMLLWTLKNAKRTSKWDLPQAPDTASMILDELERDVSGERLKTQKALRERFEQDDWLKTVFDEMTPGRQRDFFKRICKSEAWPGLDKQGIQAKIIKLFPALQSVVSGTGAAAAAERETASAAVALTSHRSYRERQEQLSKLINEEIPANAKEIAIARSYGDLRENFEYKAAKDQQAVLNSRRDKLVADLAAVRPSDFADVPKDAVAAGTAAKIRRADGSEETYYVLGEWDNDEAMHILSSATRLAKALIGHKAGDRVSVPGDAGDVECELVEVGALPQSIVDWMK
jgi:transcription elongation GreA/GreB family factor